MSQGSEQQSGWGHQCVPGCGFSEHPLSRDQQVMGIPVLSVMRNPFILLKYYLHELKT